MVPAVTAIFSDTRASLSHGAERARTALRWLLAAAYLFAGIAHLRSPQTFLAITPDWVPFPLETIMVTGICEIAGALALLTPKLRWIAGVMLAAYAVCVYPANIKHAIDGIAIGGKTLGLWYHIPRLAFQPVIVWWALFAGRVIDWPFRRRAYSN
ncbi:DoxX family protein [Sphingomonas sp. UYAg733]